jgi:hypothetical protein
MSEEAVLIFVLVIVVIRKLRNDMPNMPCVSANSLEKPRGSWKFTRVIAALKATRIFISAEVKCGFRIEDGGPFIMDGLGGVREIDVEGLSVYPWSFLCPWNDWVFNQQVFVDDVSYFPGKSNEVKHLACLAVLCDMW